MPLDYLGALLWKALPSSSTVAFFKTFPSVILLFFFLNIVHTWISILFTHFGNREIIMSFGKEVCTSIKIYFMEICNLSSRLTKILEHLRLKGRISAFVEDRSYVLLYLTPSTNLMSV